MNGQKQNRHSLMAKGIMVLLSLLVLIFIFTFAWFTNPDTPVSASGLMIKAGDSAPDFQYAIGFKSTRTGGHYVHTDFVNDPSQQLDLESLEISGYDEPINLLYDYMPIDVTGNGVKLIRPSMDYGNWKVNTASGNFSVAEPNVQYISFDLIIKTESACTLSLDKNSYARGNCELQPGDGKLIDNTAANFNPSLYGRASEAAAADTSAFSKDAIVGATRIAFVNYDNSADASYDYQKLLSEEQKTFKATPELLWITRPDLYLNNKGQDLRTYGWSLDTRVPSDSTGLKNLVSEAQTNSHYSTYIHQYYNENTKQIVEDNSSYVKTSVIGQDNKVTFGQSSQIVDVNVPEDTDNDGEPDYYYGKVNIRIWIEGTDSEARRALTDGKFSIQFDLTTH